jgi:hypothetical protein
MNEDEGRPRRAGLRQRFKVVQAVAINRDVAAFNMLTAQVVAGDEVGEKQRINASPSAATAAMATRATWLSLRGLDL